MVGTWHSLVISEVIIKRQFNHIRIAAIMRQAVSPRKMYFLLGKSIKAIIIAVENKHIDYF